MNEDTFEKELIKHITEINGSKQWSYEENIKDTAGLWDNFRRILNQHNQDKLENPLSDLEFAQVKDRISALESPYQAGQFLYGLNGVSQVEVTLDKGDLVFLTVFDQREIGAGNTIYQVVNQIQRDPVIIGKQKRRFDTTLLINGLPIIQIEEKTDSHDVNEALNQMHQYAHEGQYGDIFSTLQILVAITPNNVKYMANAPADKFNKDFAFNWQRKSDNSIVRNWREFADAMLSIPMAHQMATNYMILDGTKNKNMLKVMRPYQVYATQNVLESLKKVDFDLGTNKVGYIWHTTGSGKTITSFKTAWLASRMPKVDKVVFVVDRIALTKQTYENYLAYDPDGDMDNSQLGNVKGTESTRDLKRKLESKGQGIIVTSVQKLVTLIKDKNFKAPDKNIVFVVDEAHRSTGGDSFKNIQDFFKRAAWVGYTGTPMFDKIIKGQGTEHIFGPLLHAYTIREAIADRNVLGFKVDFETTLDEEKIRKVYLPDLYKREHPDWSEAKILRQIDKLSPEGLDEEFGPTFYDRNEEHVRLVVEDIFKNWRNRSNEGKYNALLTTKVGGMHPSTPMAMMYFREFQRVNELNRKLGKTTLKVGITFAQDTSNSNTQLETNEGLHEAVRAYNKEFGTSFDMADLAGYTQDLTTRLNKTALDKNYLDLVIVVDQLLTGFDAPELNTLYVDRTLKGAGLIQAYSRTNRIANLQEKPWGRVINYRWPAQNEILMNEALAIYANRDSAQMTDEERKKFLDNEKILAKSFTEVIAGVKKTVTDLRELTIDFNELPKGEADKMRMAARLGSYNRGVAKLKQYDPEDVGGVIEGFDYDRPDLLIKALGMSPQEESNLTGYLANELKEYLAVKEDIPVYQVDLKMTHVKDVKINYDYLTELVERLLNEVHYNKADEARATGQEIIRFADGLEDRAYAHKIKNTVKVIIDKSYVLDAYPAKLSSAGQVIEEANNKALDIRFREFRINWGIDEVISSRELKKLVLGHRFGQADLDDGGQITDLITDSIGSYKELAKDQSVRDLSGIRYRNSLRKAIYDLADSLVNNEE
ncbi:HsdR family type I site-specific deoxyribonuclease [Streptococcaceae bacterium ESL0687]|nr:HsdR family type I site-specific deoxyribonuclease [Streptococcaceae bacterium ESL0687]